MTSYQIMSRAYHFLLELFVIEVWVSNPVLYLVNSPRFMPHFSARYHSPTELNCARNIRVLLQLYLLFP